MALTTSKPIVAKWLRQAYANAALSEEDTQVGALITKGGRWIADGWNHARDGGIIHAERAAILQAADLGEEVYGATMYAPWHACEQCAEAVIEAGVRRVFGHSLVREAAAIRTPRWNDTVAAGIEMLRGAGVESIWYQGPIGARIITVQGEPFDPSGN